MSAVQSPKHPKFISVEGADIYSRSKSDGMFITLVLMESFEMLRILHWGELRGLTLFIR